MKDIFSSTHELCKELKEYPEELNWFVDEFQKTIKKLKQKEVGIPPKSN